MARTWPPQPPTPMIDSLRDQLLNLGFKAPEPTPRPRPQSRPPAGAVKEGRGGAGGAGQPRGGAAREGSRGMAALSSDAILGAARRVATRC